jgi:hypothetical protein
MTSKKHLFLSKKHKRNIKFIYLNILGNLDIMVYVDKVVDFYKDYANYKTKENTLVYLNIKTIKDRTYLNLFEVKNDELIDSKSIYLPTLSNHTINDDIDFLMKKGFNADIFASNLEKTIGFLQQNYSNHLNKEYFLEEMDYNTEASEELLEIFKNYSNSSVIEEELEELDENREDITSIAHAFNKYVFNKAN